MHISVFILFASMIKFCLKCTLIYAADIKKADNIFKTSAVRCLSRRSCSVSYGNKEIIIKIIAASQSRYLMFEKDSLQIVAFFFFLGGGGGS